MSHRLTAAVLLGWLLTAPALAALTVYDDTGRAVILAHPAQRIVTLAPHATELVVAAGAANRLVAIAAGYTPAGISPVPPLVGGPGALDREALLALQPDLVIGWQTGNRAADLDWIARTGVALYRSEPGSLADIAAAIRALGTLAGSEATAQAAASAFEQASITPCAMLPMRPAFVLIWEAPPMSVGGRHWINDVLRTAGFRNLFAGLDRGVFPIAPEALLAAQQATQIRLLPRAPAAGDALPAELLSRPGTRLPEAVQRLCELRLATSEGR